MLEQPALVTDVSGQVIAGLDRFAEAVGMTGKPARTTSLETVLGPQGYKQLHAMLSSAGEGTDAASCHIRLADGTSRHLMAERVTAPTGTEFVVARVVTDRLLDGAGLRYLLEHLDQGVWSFAAQTKCFTVSNAWRRLRDLPNTKAQRVGLSDWIATIHPDDQEAVASIFTGKLKGQSDSIHVQYRNIMPDGSCRTMLCRAKTITRDDTGHPILIVGMDTDITDIKRKEVAQLELASKLQLANDVAGIGLWEFDSRTASVHWDDRQLEIYGIKDGVNERPNDIWEDFLHPDDRDAAIEGARRALEENRDFHQDYRIVRPDGEVRHLRSAARYISVAGSNGKLIGVNIDVTEDYRRTEELERVRRQLEHDSRHDALTGLANRRLLDDTVHTLLENIGPTDHFAVLHLDLDHFKQVNDTMGHAAGDMVLLHMADILRSCVGHEDLVCRIGGDEFVVLVPRMLAQADIHALAERILNKVAEPVVMQGQVCTFGTSIGAAIGQGGINDASEVFINADVALYAAKSDGRSRYKIFSPLMRGIGASDRAVHHDISSALDHGHIICHFQPQFDAQTRQMIGAEALVRWACPKRGLLLPDQFVPQARAVGLGERLDETVLDYVLAEQNRWAAAGLFVPVVALNISAERLRQPDLLDQIEAKLKPHHRVSFELLETAFLDQLSDGLADMLDVLRAKGVRLDLDDFGSGHASVVALQAIRPDRVKIDRLLVAPIETNPEQLLILEALVRVAELEGCGVVIEGIETDRQLQAISGLRAEALQGYALARPVTSAVFADLLASMGGCDTSVVLASRSKQGGRP